LAGPEARREPKIRRTIIAGAAVAALTVINADRPAARRAKVRLRADRALARDLARPCFFAGLE
jgi:hypothetical protein